MSGIGINFSLHTAPIKEVSFHPKGNTKITTKITTEVVGNIGKKETYSHLRENGLSKQQIIDTINHLSEPSVAQELIKKVDSFEPEHKKTEVIELGRTLKEDFEIPKAPTSKGLSSGFEPSSAGQAIGKFSNPISSDTEVVSAIGGSSSSPPIVEQVDAESQEKMSNAKTYIETSMGLDPNDYQIDSIPEFGKDYGCCHHFALPNGYGAPGTVYPGSGTEIEPPQSLEQVSKWAEEGKTIVICFGENFGDKGVAHTAVLDHKYTDGKNLLQTLPHDDKGNPAPIFRTNLKTLKDKYEGQVMIFDPAKYKIPSEKAKMNFLWKQGMECKISRSNPFDTHSVSYRAPKKSPST